MAGKHGGDPHHTKTEVVEMNRNVSPLQAETDALLKGQRVSPKVAITDAGQHEELALKEAQAKVAKLEGLL